MITKRPPWNGKPVNGREPCPYQQEQLYQRPIQSAKRSGKMMPIGLRSPEDALYRSWGDAGGYIPTLLRLHRYYVRPKMEIWDCAAIVPASRRNEHQGNWLERRRRF